MKATEMNFSEKFRSEKGIAQEQLAKEFFVLRNLIAKYENNIVFPTKENIGKIVNIILIILAFALNDKIDVIILLTIAYIMLVINLFLIIGSMVFSISFIRDNVIGLYK